MQASLLLDVESFLEKTSSLHPAALGMFVRLLAYQTQHGIIPRQPSVIQQITGTAPHEFDKWWPRIVPLLTELPAGYVEKELHMRLQAQYTISLKRRAAGVRGGRPRKPAPVAPRPRRTKEDVERDDEAFERFWRVFPMGRKKGKKKAKDSFLKAIKECEAERIISRAAAYAKSREGQGEYVKMPATWLNQGCWDDDERAWNGQTVDGGQSGFGTF